MQENLEKISFFLNEHHVMSLATTYQDELSVCSLFYLYDKQSCSFIVASSDDTTHINHIKFNNKIAGNIPLETLNVDEIKGVQFRGDFLELHDESLKEKYFQRFPYSLALNPKLWQIKVNYFKMSDNSLGFAKKIIWP